MNSTPGLLDRLTALRKRLEAAGPREVRPDRASPHQQLLVLEHEVARLRAATTRLQTSSATLQGEAELEMASTMPRCTWRVRRQLLRVRGQLDKLRALLPTFTQPALLDAVPGLLFQSTHEVAELALRTVGFLPEAEQEQERLAVGLEALLGEVDSRLRRLERLELRLRRWQGRVQSLSEIIQKLLNRQSAGWAEVATLAAAVQADAEMARPLIWHDFDAERPLRWAAAAGLNAAQVLARILPFVPEWRERAEDALIAALLCECGMATLPSALFESTGSLTEEEQRSIEAHATAGAEALAAVFPDRIWLAAAVRGHHERPDGTGYPTGARGAEIPLLARLLAVATSYAALAVPRPWRPAYRPDAALREILIQAERGGLDSTAAELLLKIGPYPVGSVVELSDGTLAQVVGLGAEGGSVPQPLVNVLSGLESEGDRFIDLQRARGIAIVRGFSLAEARQLVSEPSVDLW